MNECDVPNEKMLPPPVIVSASNRAADWMCGNWVSMSLLRALVALWRYWRADISVTSRFVLFDGLLVGVWAAVAINAHEHGGRLAERGHFLHDGAEDQM